MRPLPASVHVATGMALVNAAMVALRPSEGVIITLFIICPLIVIWMVWQVLRDRSVPVRDLKQGEEWGYQDKPGPSPFAKE
ncbi:MAG: hypothetical protein ACK4L7_00180 [Flavobacteriales bacterium]